MSLSDSEKLIVASVAKLCGVVKCEAILGCIFAVVAGTVAILGPRSGATIWGGVFYFIFGFSFLLLAILAVTRQSPTLLIILGVCGLLATADCILSFVLFVIDLIAAIEDGSRHDYVFVYYGEIISYGWYLTFLVSGVVGSFIGTLLFAWASFDAFRLSRMVGKAARIVENCDPEAVVVSTPPSPPTKPRHSALQVDESAQPSQETPPPSYSFVV